MRLLVSYPAERRKVVDFWVDQIKQLGEFDVVAGTATAGIPHAAWISDQMDLPMVYIRGKAKEHGKKEQIEGLFKSGQKAVIVEDLISTGKSSLESHRAVVEKNGTADHVASIYNYTLPIAQENFEQAGVTLTSLTKRGDMKAEDQEVVLDWLQDAAGWGKRHGME
jgi:orotate phosphoribosyltransferase